MAQPVKLVIDTDPGVDDAIAILMALAAPEVEVVGLTSVGGNAPLARTTRNILALLQAANREDISVAKGASRPMQGKFKYAVQFHGPGGLSYRLPEPVIKPVDQGAVSFLDDLLTKESGEIVLVALGPLTNVARLLREHPYALEQAKNIVVMGGAVNTPGNVTPHAEFNTYCDPVAAKIVFSSGLPVTLVDLAACRQVGISRKQAFGLQSRHPLGQLTVGLLQGWFKKEPSRQRFDFYDPLAMAFALEPAVASVKKIDLDVDLEQSQFWGATWETGGPGEITVLGDVHAPRFFKFLEESLGLEGLPTGY